MKFYHKTIILIMAVCAGFSLKAQDADTLGLPGDDLDLYGVIDLFSKATSVEEFEKALNDEANKVNNLDLNADGEIDYIRVMDNMEDEAHALVLRVPLDENESQDMACIALEKKGNEEAHIQVIGDEDMYGTDYIIEPTNENKEGGKGSTLGGGIIVNVWFWPCVRFVYAPAYVVWVSPWHWHHYPHYWHPWRPMAWHVWHPHVTHYHARYVHVHHCHVVHARTVYHGHRVRSTTVVHHGRAVKRNDALRDSNPGRKDNKPGKVRDNKPTERQKGTVNKPTKPRGSEGKPAGGRKPAPKGNTGKKGGRG